MKKFILFSLLFFTPLLKSIPTNVESIYSLNIELLTLKDFALNLASIIAFGFILTTALGFRTAMILDAYC